MDTIEKRIGKLSDVLQKKSIYIPAKVPSQEELPTMSRVLKTFIEAFPSITLKFVRSLKNYLLSYNFPLGMCDIGVTMAIVMYILTAFMDDKQVSSISHKGDPFLARIRNIIYDGDIPSIDTESPEFRPTIESVHRTLQSMDIIEKVINGADIYKIIYDNLDRTEEAMQMHHIVQEVFFGSPPVYPPNSKWWETPDALEVSLEYPPNFRFWGTSHELGMYPEYQDNTPR